MVNKNSTPPPQYGFSVSVWFHLINSQYMLNIIPHIWQGCAKTNPNIQHEIIFFNSFSMTIRQNLQCELLTRNYIFYCVFWFYVKWASNFNISAKYHVLIYLKPISGMNQGTRWVFFLIKKPRGKKSHAGLLVKVHSEFQPKPECSYISATVHSSEWSIW
jgi:hypothetical protein